MALPRHAKTPVEMGAELLKHCMNLRWLPETRIKKVSALIAAGAPLNVRSDDGMTSLLWAAYRGYEEIADMLLAAGANYNAVDDDGWTALMHAAMKGHAPIVEKLLAVGTPIRVNNVDKNGWTALIHAANDKQLSTVEALMAGGANLDIQNCIGNTALIHAAMNGAGEIAVALVRGGANVHLKNHEGRCAVATALHYGEQEITFRIAETLGEMEERRIRKGVYLEKDIPALPKISLGKKFTAAVTGAPAVKPERYCEFVMISRKP